MIKLCREKFYVSKKCLILKHKTMKKVILITLLSIGTCAFAANPKKVKPLKKTKAVACCTVGTVTECGFSFEPLCDRARAKYCATHQCKETLTVYQP